MSEVKEMLVHVTSRGISGPQHSAEGLRPINEKISAIVDASVPQDVTQLRAFFGLLKYYVKFLKNLSSLLATNY